MKWLLAALALVPSLAWGQPANVNPQAGQVWQYYGPTLGSGWGPITILDYLTSFTVAGAPVNANSHGLTVGYGPATDDHAKLQVRNEYTGASGSPLGAYLFLDYMPPGGGTHATNPNGAHGTIWYDAPGAYTGLGGAGKFNAYSIAQLTAAIAAAGSGYTNGDVVTIVGGTCNTLLNTPPRFTLTVAAGIVTGATYFKENSACTVYPSNPVSVTGGTGSSLTLNLTNTAVDITYLVGAYGRGRHTATGTATTIAGLFSDGCYNTGGGSVTKCTSVFMFPPYGTGITASYGLWADGAFADGTIGSATGIDITINPGTGGRVSTTSNIVAGIGAACSARMQGGTVTAVFQSLGTDCPANISSQGAGVVGIYNENTLIGSFAPTGGADTTSMVLQVNNGSGVTMQPVTLGIDNSGGVGFKLLRVPN